MYGGDAFPSCLFPCCAMHRKMRKCTTFRANRFRYYPDVQAASVLIWLWHRMCVTPWCEGMYPTQRAGRPLCRSGMAARAIAGFPSALGRPAFPFVRTCRVLRWPSGHSLPRLIWRPPRHAFPHNSQREWNTLEVSRPFHVRGYLLRALTPGSSLPSSHSRKAPPAVET